MKAIGRSGPRAWLLGFPGVQGVCAVYLQRVENRKEILIDQGEALAEVGDIDNAGCVALTDYTLLFQVWRGQLRRAVIVRPAGARRIVNDPISVSGIDLIYPVWQELGEGLLLLNQSNKLKE
jgi:hypothetical protein